MRTIDGKKLMQMNEALASYLQDGRLEKADKLDAEMNRKPINDVY